MVKGVTKRVVVVRCPDTRFFDQAIFMVREDAIAGMDQEAVLKEACRAADGYIRENAERKKPLWPWLLGAGCCAAAIMLCAVIFL